MSRPIPGAVLAALLLAGLIVIIFPLYAQTPEPSLPADAGVSFEADVSAESAPLGTGAAVGSDESAIFLGDDAAAPAVPAVSSSWVVLRMVLVLALAALAIYGVVFFIKRLARPRENRDPYLKVLASVSLGADSYAAVISLGAKAWLVGGGSGGLNLISEINDTETLETLLLDDARRSAETGGGRVVDFRSLLSRLGVRGRGEGPVSPGASHAENIRRQRERLKGL